MPTGPALTLLLPPLARLRQDPEACARIAAALARADEAPAGAPGRAARLRDWFDTGRDEPAAAPLTRTLDARDAAEGRWLRADPAHVAADLTQARLLACGGLGLAGDECAAFERALKPLFGDTGFEFSAPHPDRWYLRLPPRPSCRAVRPRNRRSARTSWTTCRRARRRAFPAPAERGAGVAPSAPVEPASHRARPGCGKQPVVLGRRRLAHAREEHVRNSWRASTRYVTGLASLAALRARARAFRRPPGGTGASLADCRTSTRSRIETGSDRAAALALAAHLRAARRRASGRRTFALVHGAPLALLAPRAAARMSVRTRIVRRACEGERGTGRTRARGRAGACCARAACATRRAPISACGTCFRRTA
jgi:hypothetical protein